MDSVFAAYGLYCSTARGILQDKGLNLGFPGSSVGKESACNAGHPGSIPGWEDPLEKEMATHSSILVWQATIQESSKTGDCIVKWMLYPQYHQGCPGKNMIKMAFQINRGKAWIIQ